MIRRLRWKFVLIDMSLVTAILVVLCAVLLATTGDSLRQDSLAALEQAVSLNNSAPDFSITLTPDDRSDEEYDLFGDEKVQLPFFTVQIGGEDLIMVLANQFFDTSDQEALTAVVNAALQSPTDNGTITESGYSLRFLRVNTMFGYRIAFVDRTQEQSTMGALARNLVLICLGALVVFFFISILLARWAVRPVEKSWKQQRRFVADASHELKTPLTVILSSLDMLKVYGGDQEKQQRWLENVRAASEQMKVLVEEMLVLARSDNATQQSQLQPCDLTDLVEDSLLLFEPLAFEQGKTLRDQLAPHVVVTGDPSQLKRILDIYLDNACKYAPDGTVITVKLAAEGRRAVLSVHSQGAPIPKEQLERIFERFYRADPSRTEEGYGLGLAIATELAKLHHGRVWAESDDTGNTFFFTMPRAKEDRAPERPMSSPVAEIPTAADASQRPAPPAVEEASQRPASQELTDGPAPPTVTGAPADTAAPGIPGASDPPERSEPLAASEGGPEPSASPAASDPDAPGPDRPI